MRIAIPSYRRVDEFDQLTCEYLFHNDKLGNVGSMIDVFVSDAEDEAKYKARFPNFNIINTGANNIVEKFNYIHNYYKVGERVIVMEDDIKSVKKLNSDGKLTECVDILKHFDLAFDIATQSMTKLVGINSNSNPFFMKDKISVGFKFIVANVYGFIATRNKELQITQTCKSDYERTILYYLRYSSVVRIDYLCPVTNNYVTRGGMQTDKEKRHALETQAVVYLTKKYPQLCKRNVTKSSIYPEVLLTKPK